MPPHRLGPMRSLGVPLLLLLLMAAGAVAVGMALPLLRKLYGAPSFLWVSIGAALGAAVLAALLPVRAATPLRRKVFFFALAAGVVTAEAVHLYRDQGSPVLWEASPQVLVFFRELVHIVEYGFLAVAATRLVKNEVGGPEVYLFGAAYAVTVGIADETLQWLHAFRVGDIRDVVLNGVSACSGLLYQASFWSPPPVRSTLWARVLLLTTLFASPLCFAEFYIRTQTGHRICDENGVCFTSHFTKPELRVQARDRMERWKGAAPGSLAGENEKPVFFRREDYFLTEARAHLRLANEAIDAGDLRSACVEMSILAAYYAPSLHGLAARPERLSCAAEIPRGESGAFRQLDTGARPMAWRASAAAAALALAMLGGTVSRRRNGHDQG